MKYKLIYSWALEETMFQTSEIYSQIDQCRREERIVESTHVSHSVYVRRYFDKSELC